MLLRPVVSSGDFRKRTVFPYRTVYIDYCLLTGAGQVEKRTVQRCFCARTAKMQQASAQFFCLAAAAFETRRRRALAFFHVRTGLKHISDLIYRFPYFVPSGKRLTDNGFLNFRLPEIEEVLRSMQQDKRRISVPVFQRTALALARLHSFRLPAYQEAYGRSDITKPYCKKPVERQIGLCQSQNKNRG